MKPSAAVLTAGIVLLVGSLVLLAMAVLMGLALLVVPGTTPDKTGTVPPVAGFVVVLGLLTLLVPATWGIITSIGVFRLKAWARVSMIVVGVLTGFFHLFSAAFMLVLPLPTSNNPHVDATFFASIRMGFAAFYLVLVGIGVWWAVLFTRSSVKAEFAPTISQSATATAVPPFDGIGTPPLSRVPTQRARPLGISIIAWFLIGTALFFPINVLMHAPAVFLGKVLVGPMAMALMALFTVVNLVLGIGLLRLNARARQLVIVYVLFGIVNSWVSFVGPGYKARWAAIMNAQPAFMRQPSIQPAVDMAPFMWVGLAMGVVIAAVILYVLVKAKPAFQRASVGLN